MTRGLHCTLGVLRKHDNTRQHKTTQDNTGHHLAIIVSSCFIIPSCHHVSSLQHSICSHCWVKLPRAFSLCPSWPLAQSSSAQTLMTSGHGSWTVRAAASRLVIKYLVDNVPLSQDAQNLVRAAITRRPSRPERTHDSADGAGPQLLIRTSTTGWKAGSGGMEMHLMLIIASHAPRLVHLRIFKHLMASMDLGTKCLPRRTQ